MNEVEDIYAGIPEEAVERVAKALFERHYDLSNWSEVDVFIRRVFLVAAAGALEAAAPILMAHAWDEGAEAGYQLAIQEAPCSDYQAEQNPYRGKGA